MKASTARTLFLVIVASAIAALCVVSIKTNANNRVEVSAVGKEISRVSPPKTMTLNAPTQEDPKGFWLTVRSNGFETREMTVVAGDYFVVIQNATGLDDFALRIEREPGQRIHEVRLPRLKKRWRKRITLTPGIYTVSEVDHAEWSCRITVTASQ